MRRLVLLVLSLLVLPVAVAPPAAAAEIVLSTDARGALFADGQLSPKYKSTRCLQVRWTDNEVSRQLGVSAKVHGALAPYLTLQVEVGHGGGYSSCAGFEGDVIYDGSVGDFGAAHSNAAEQLLARKITAAAGSATFRMTVAVKDVNEAQSRTASQTSSSRPTMRGDCRSCRRRRSRHPSRRTSRHPSLAKRLPLWWRRRRPRRTSRWRRGGTRGWCRTSDRWTRLRWRSR